jgi:hypothetical protein
LTDEYTEHSSQIWYIYRLCYILVKHSTTEVVAPKEKEVIFWLCHQLAIKYLVLEQNGRIRKHIRVPTIKK